MENKQIIDYKLHIEINPEIRFGKPCIKNTRISVYDVLGWFASGMTQEEILEDFPQLTKENILACFAYFATDNNAKEESMDFFEFYGKGKGLYNVDAQEYVNELREDRMLW